MKNYEVSIMAVQIATKILDIVEPKISFDTNNFFIENNISAVFIKEKYEIVFNKEWVEKSQWIEVVASAFHETRHAYQWYSILNDINEPSTTLLKWKKEFIDYNSVKSGKDIMLDIDYLKQEIEVDAIRFTYELMKDLFGVKTIIPKEIKHLFL